MRLALFALLALSACAQNASPGALQATTTTPLGTTADAIAAMPLPTYLGCGGAYNQFGGYNAFCTGIFPLSKPAALLMDTTVDVFPIKTTVNGKTGYLLTTSARVGINRYLVHQSKFFILYGVDGGFSWAQAIAGATPAAGVSAAVTVTPGYQFTKNLAGVAPIRGVYMPTMGGWNPIVAGGFVYTIGAAK